jgi:hypothetical protein
MFQNDNSTHQRSTVDSSTTDLFSHLSKRRLACIKSLVCLLHEAYIDAQVMKADPWEYANTLYDLTHAGTAVSDIRWLVANHVVDHALEKLSAVQKSRSFRPVTRLSIQENSCFVLTEYGLSLIAKLTHHGEQTGPESMKVSGSAKPHWDAELRELTWDGLLVKRFRTPSICQELILTVFQEEAWPQRIDDPLQPVRGQDPRVRLHDIIRRLNGRQHAGRLRFTRDGTGKGICWEADRRSRVPEVPPPRPLVA